MSENARNTLTEEILQAAFFCAGVSQLWKRVVRFSPGERFGSDACVEIGGRTEEDPTRYGVQPVHVRQILDPE
jgi:hypothetical protein